MKPSVRREAATGEEKVPLAKCTECIKDCLINLMILPFQAGLGLESTGTFPIASTLLDLTITSLQLANANMDDLTFRR